MPKFKLNELAPLVFIVVISACSTLWAQQGNIDYEKKIEKYSLLLNKDPKNCFYLDQLATCYQALNNYKKAIFFYERVLTNCPDNLLDKFQLGVCYLLIMDRETAIKYMDQAIDMAKNNKKKNVEEMFLKEKGSWLKQWELIKTMGWNKRGNGVTH